MTRRLLPLAVALAVTLVLAFAVSGFVREVIVVPALYAGWFTWLILLNLPQWIFWALLVIVTFVLALRSLRGPRRQRPDKKPGAAQAQGPVSTWSHRLKNVPSQPTSRWRVSRDLGHIFWETRFPDEPFNMQQFLQRISEPAMAMPPEIRNYFEAGLARPQPTYRSWFRPRRREAASPLDLDPAIAIQFLENTFDLISSDPMSNDPIEGEP